MSHTNTTSANPLNSDSKKSRPEYSQSHKTMIKILRLGIAAKWVNIQNMLNICQTLPILPTNVNKIAYNSNT